MQKIFIFLFLSLISLYANTQEPLQKVSVQLLWKHQFEFAGFYMAHEKGFYADANLDVDIKEFSHGINITKDVESGISTFGIGYPNLILEKSQGANIVLLNALFQSSPHILIALKKSGIKTIQDFKNKKIMMEDDAILNAPLLSMFFSQKISLDQMQLIKPTFNIYDLINGKVDIFSAYSSNELYTLDRLGIPYTIFDPKEYGFNFYNGFIFTAASLAKKDPELVSRFQNATLKGWIYAFEHIDETITLIREKYSNKDKSYQALSYEAKSLQKHALVKGISLGDIQKYKVEEIKNIYALMGLIDNNFQIKDDFIFDSTKIYLSKKEKEFIKNTSLTISVSKDFKPISFQDTDGSATGIATEYFKILAKELGLTLLYKFDSVFTNQLNDIKNKKADLILSAASTKDRKKYARFTDKYIDFPIVIATKNNQNFIEDFSNVIDKKIAVGRNFTAHKLLHSLYPDINFVFVENIKEGLQLVQKGEVFGFVEMRPTLSYNIKKLHYEDIKIAGNTGATFQLSIMVRDDYPILQSILNKAIHSLEPTNLDTIVQGYENIKFEKEYDYKMFYLALALFCVIIIVIILKHYFLNKTNKKLQILVDEKTKNLQDLNETLEQRIEKAILENSKKDAILYQQSKNAQMGEMIGNIAHQWRQPLSLISTAASGILAQKEYGVLNDKQEEKSLNAIIEKVNFLSDTIDTFRDYIKEKKELQEVVLQERIESDINIIEASLTNNYITLHKNITQCKPITINVLAGELSQVVINILNNAKDALIERKIKNPQIFLALTQQGKKAIISIEDNAGGIKEEHLSKIFNPYFTTKHQSNGTGLGLYMSKEIVEKHLNGDLSVFNSKKGAIFTITLPL